MTVYEIGPDPAFRSFNEILHMVFYICVGMGTIVLLIGLFLGIGRMLRGWKLPVAVPVFCIALGALALSGIFWLYVHRSPRLHLDSAALLSYKKGNYQRIEGAVEDFDPMPYDGHKNECFSVKDKRFCYSDYAIEPGFRNTASHGGPIRPGLLVRIAYLPTPQRNMILRLEIAKGVSSEMH